MRRPTLFFISFPEGQPQKRSSPSTKPTINPEMCKCVTNPQIFSALFWSSHKDQCNRLLLQISNASNFHWDTNIIGIPINELSNA